MIFTLFNYQQFESEPGCFRVLRWTGFWTLNKHGFNIVGWLQPPITDMARCRKVAYLAVIKCDKRIIPLNARHAKRVFDICTLEICATASCCSSPLAKFVQAIKVLWSIIQPCPWKHLWILTENWRQTDKRSNSRSTPLRWKGSFWR